MTQAPRTGTRLLSLLFTGACLALPFPIPTLARPITALTFSPDGSRLLSNGHRAVEIRDPSDARVLLRWDCPLSKISCLRFDRNGRWLAIAGGTPGEHGETFLRSWPNGETAARWSVTGDLATSLDFSPNGDRIVVADALGQARIWSVPEAPSSQSAPAPVPTPEQVLAGHTGPILAVAWSPSKDVIVTAGADRSLKVWSASDGQLLRTFHHHTEAPNALAFQPAGRTPAGSAFVCASGADDRTVRIWQPSIGRMVRIVRHHAGSILSLAWLPDGHALLSAGTEGIVRLVDASSDRVLSEWPLSSDWILTLAIRPDGSQVAAGDASGRITFQSLPSSP